MATPGQMVTEREPPSATMSARDEACHSPPSASQTTAPVELVGFARIGPIGV